MTTKRWLVRLLELEAPESIRERLEQANPEAIVMDEYDGALLGVLEAFDRPSVAVYSRRLIQEHLMARDGMTSEEASEFFEFNIGGGYLGPDTPVFVE